MTKTLKKKFIFYLGTCLFCFLSIGLTFSYFQNKHGIIALLDPQARILLSQAVITRAWVADHGGLFVKKKEGVGPNLLLPATDIVDQEGNIYHFRNPARSLAKFLLMLKKGQKS